MNEPSVRRWFQVSIREVFLATALLAAMLACLTEHWQFVRYQRQAEAVFGLRASAIADFFEGGGIAMDRSVEINGQRFHCTVWKGDPRLYDAPPAEVPRLSPPMPPPESE